MKVKYDKILGKIREQDGADGLANPMTTAGDIIVGSTDGAPARLAKGADGKVLGVESGAVAWVTPTGGSPQKPAPIIKNIPVMDGNPALHFALELFLTPDYSGTALESYDTGSDPQGVTVNDGSAWIAFPSDGIGTLFYGNQLYIIPQSALSNAPYFVRYKFYLKGTSATDEPWNYTIYPANLIGA